MTNPPEGWQPEQEQPYSGPPSGQQPYFGQPAPYGQQPPYGQPYGPTTPYGQPQYRQTAPYGQQPYGPYAPQFTPPPRKSRSGLIVGVLVLALAIVAAAVLIPKALSYQVLDPSAVQRDVAAQFEQREGVKVNLSCPQRMKVSNGATYQCSGTTAQGDKVTVDIRIVDQGTAAYTWSPR